MLLVSGGGNADAPAPVGLSGPTLDAVITCGKTILPASEVPNLAEGDRIWLKPEFPKSHSAHYLMVAAFLSGPTNPPPKAWFFSCKTWTGKCARAGLTVTVPPGAKQVLEIGRESRRDREGRKGQCVVVDVSIHKKTQFMVLDYHK